MPFILNDVEYETYEEMQAALNALQEEYDEFWEGEEVRSEAERPLSAEELLAVLVQRTDVADSLPDEVVAKMAPYFPAWDASASYSVGDKVGYVGKVWRCLQAHTAQESWSPDAASSLWAKVLIPDPTVIPEWEQPSGTNPYMHGDKVTHNDKTWVSDIDNNVWEPGVYGWSEV